MTTTVRGINTVMRNLNRKAAEIEFKLPKGMVKVASMVRRDMDNSPPVIPIDIGNLRASWFSVVKGYEPKSRGVFTGRTPAERQRASEMAAEHKQVLSDYKAVVEGQKSPSVVMGFTANYATAVHEMYGSNIQWKRPSSGPGFFRLALYRNRKKIIQTLKENTVK